MTTLVYLLACYGLTFTLCSATILDRPRFWIVDKSEFAAKLLSCYSCTWFWVSLVLYPAIFLLDQDLADLTWKTAIKAVAHSFAGATFAYGFDSLIRAAEAAGEQDG
jgi:hypothetical protein